MKDKPKHNTRIWLNHPDSSSTSSVVCFSGMVNWLEIDSNKPATTRFVEISDCHGKVRLHQSQFESLSEFKDKIDRLINALQNYSNSLMQEMKNENR